MNVTEIEKREKNERFGMEMKESGWHEKIGACRNEGGENSGCWDIK